MNKNKQFLKLFFITFFTTASYNNCMKKPLTTFTKINKKPYITLKEFFKGSSNLSFFDFCYQEEQMKNENISIIDELTNKMDWPNNHKPSIYFHVDDQFFECKKRKIELPNATYIGFKKLLNNKLKQKSDDYIIVNDLFNTLPHEERKSILAHELGHTLQKYKNQHKKPINEIINGINNKLLLNIKYYPFISSSLFLSSYISEHAFLPISIIAGTQILYGLKHSMYEQKMEFDADDNVKKLHLSANFINVLNQYETTINKEKDQINFYNIKQKLVYLFGSHPSPSNRIKNIHSNNKSFQKKYLLKKKIINFIIGTLIIEELIQINYKKYKNKKTKNKSNTT